MLLAADITANDIVADTELISPSFVVVGSQGSVDTLVRANGVFGDFQTWLSIDGGGSLLSHEEQPSINFELIDLRSSSVDADNFQLNGGVADESGLLRAIKDSAGQGLVIQFPYREFVPPDTIERLPLLISSPSDGPSSDGPSSTEQQQVAVALDSPEERPEEHQQRASAEPRGLVSLAKIFRDADIVPEIARPSRTTVLTTINNEEIGVFTQAHGVDTVNENQRTKRTAHANDTEPDGLWALDFAFAEEGLAVEDGKEAPLGSGVMPSKEQASGAGQGPQHDHAAAAEGTESTDALLFSQEEASKYRNLDQVNATRAPAMRDAGYPIGSTLVGATLIARVWLGARYPRRDRAEGFANDARGATRSRR